MIVVNPVVMPFGKYRGVCLHDVPSDYLQWAFEELENVDPALLKAIDGELGRRARELATAKAASARRRGGAA